MKPIVRIFLVVMVFWSCTKSNPECIIHSSLGDIEVELYEDQAPVTVNNFLRYIDSSYFDSCTFFRLCTKQNEADREYPIEVIQAADLPAEKLFKPIEIETTKQTGIKHLDGTISMARDKPNSAQCSFFICVGDQPELDYGGKRNPDGYGFAAFGRVTKGMDVVRKIQELENSEQMLLEPVLISSIERQ